MFEKRKSVWLFLLPGLAMLMIFYIVPFFSGIGYSLTDGSYKNAFVGLQNYRDLGQQHVSAGAEKHDGAVAYLCAAAVGVLVPAGQRAERDQNPSAGFSVPAC
ncbi:MAG: hypothetical protein ACLVJB_04690 [Christensenellales bacterium]